MSSCSRYLGLDCPLLLLWRVCMYPVDSRLLHTQTDSSSCANHLGSFLSSRPRNYSWSAIFPGPFKCMFLFCSRKSLKPGTFLWAKSVVCLVRLAGWASRHCSSGLRGPRNRPPHYTTGELNHGDHTWFGSICCQHGAIHCDRSPLKFRRLAETLSRMHKCKNLTKLHASLRVPTTATKQLSAHSMGHLPLMAAMTFSSLTTAANQTTERRLEKKK